MATDPAASRSTFRASLSNAFSSTALNFSAGARACFALSPRFACVFCSGSRRWRLGGRSLVEDPKQARRSPARATARRGPADGSKLGEGRPPGPQQRTPKNVPRSARGAPSGPRPAATCGRTTGARCRARPAPASMACCARPPRWVRARSSLVVGGVLPAPNPDFVSDDEGPIQECQTFHLDIASYCGLDDDDTLPRNRPKSSLRARRHKDEDTKTKRTRETRPVRRRAQRAGHGGELEAPPRDDVGERELVRRRAPVWKSTRRKATRNNNHAGKRTSGSGRAPPRRSSS